MESYSTNIPGLKTKASRREFMKWSAVVGGTAALAPVLHETKDALANKPTNDASTFVWSACTVNCGSRCPLRLEVKDGTIVRVLPDDSANNKVGSQQVRACVRGRSIRHRIYNPDRLKKPMKRKPGTKRGDEQWVTISWDQALDEIAEKMKKIKARYGNEAFYINYGTGTLGSVMAKSWPPDQSAFARLMNTWGGYLDHYSDYSTTEITQAYPYFYGSWVGSNSFDDVKNSKLQVMFGNNPAETRMSGGGQVFVSQQTRKASGVRTIVIDPRYSETAITMADEWIPIRPGTDAALVAGLIHTMITEDLHNQAFLDHYCVGFDDKHLPEGTSAGSSYRAYLEGKGPDHTIKNAQWASHITGVPAERIRRLAREIAAANPCAITQGWGPSVMPTEKIVLGRSSCSQPSPATLASPAAEPVLAKAPKPSSSPCPSTLRSPIPNPTRSSQCSLGWTPSTMVSRWTPSTLGCVKSQPPEYVPTRFPSTSTASRRMSSSAPPSRWCGSTRATR